MMNKKNKDRINEFYKYFRIFKKPDKIIIRNLNKKINN